MYTSVDVVVIGAGQAGLASAHGIADLPGLPMRRPVRVESVRAIDDVLVVTAAGGAR